MNGQLKIDEMYAFVAVDKKDNTEGVVSFFNKPLKTWMPLVGADMARVMSLRMLAQHVANNEGIEIKLLKFGVREEIETIKPEN